MEKKNPVSQEELDRMIEEKYRELERLEAERQNREQGGYTSPSYEDAHNFYEGESDTVHRDSLGSTGGYRSASRGEGLTENGNGETPRRRPTGESYGQGAQRRRPTGEGYGEGAPRRRPTGEDYEQRAQRRRPTGEDYEQRAQRRRPTGEGYNEGTPRRRPTREGYSDGAPRRRPAGEGYSDGAARRRPAEERYSDGATRRRAASEDYAQEMPRRRAAGSTGDGYGERQSREAGRSRDGYEEAPRRRSGQDGQRVSNERRQQEENRRRQEAQYRSQERQQRYEEVEEEQEDEGMRREEKPFFSEKIIRLIGGIIGIIIVLLVVITIFGGKIFSKLASGGDTTQLASGKGVINILLVGQDGREDVEGSRSDSMMLVSVNKGTGKVKIVSLMRDMYVSIPGHDDNRINAAYSLGGVKLLEQTIENDFQVKIDGNVQIDFESFKTIIDKVDGVEIELSQEEADYLNTAYWQNGWSLSAGVQTLDGDQALAYSRIRQVGNSDFQRTERQRTVLMTVFRKVKGQGKLKMLSLAKDIYPMLDTDIGIGDMISLGTTAIGMDESDIETYRLPIDGGYTNQTIREMQVLVPDMEKNIAYLKELLFGETQTE
ncbi:LCP family protein [Oscillospiraceae bacterium Marseille-Q3528]|nr:LCP family protein [Oscillospiraceae bacterium Marseille-Q3528]